jgi:hypothetical protein
MQRKGIEKKDPLVSVVGVKRRETGLRKMCKEGE